MNKTICKCEMCPRVAKNEDQLRRENWIRVKGGILAGIEVFLDKPRQHKDGVADSYMIHIGWRDREYHFCSIECLVRALKGDRSI